MYKLLSLMMVCLVFQYCQCFGFICEMCRNQNDVIFPYQLSKVTICQGMEILKPYNVHLFCYAPPLKIMGGH